MALTNKLSAIGNAIREKLGTTELMTLDAMPAAITSIPTGGGGGDAEPIVLTGNCDYALAGPLTATVVERQGDTISTVNITQARNILSYSPLKSLPFTLNFNPNEYVTYVEYMFANATSLETVPEVHNAKPAGTNDMFKQCTNLRTIPEDFGSDWNWSYIDNYNGAWGGSMSGMFYNCYSLRNLPMKMLEHGNPEAYSSYVSYYMMCYCCNSLDEVVGLGIPYTRGSYTSNLFYGTFTQCYRLKRFTFAETSEPVKWSNQTIDLTPCGVSPFVSYILDYNNGITANKQVTDDATYQALKDDPDWFTCDSAYSRYNHDSVVETINSLPQIADGYGTNVIQLQDALRGINTDGGAIGDLTEEELAVATAKGWTVTIY